MDKKVFLFLLPLLISIDSLSQVQSNISLFYKTPLLFNPAAAGSEEHLNLFFLQKNQSLNYPGMPSLTVISGSLPFNYQRWGAGLNLIKETTLYSNALSANINFSYKINFYKGRLSFGARTGFIHRSENVSTLSAKDPENITINRNVYLSEGIGLFYKDKKSFGGISFDRSAGIYLNKKQALINQYYFSAGSSYKLSKDFFFYPTLQVKYLNGFPLLAGVAFPFIYKDFLLAAVSVNSSLTTSFSAGIDAATFLANLNKSLFIVYSYDQVWGDLSFLGNTHEVAMIFNFGNTDKIEDILKRKITVSPLYFD